MKAAVEEKDTETTTITIDHVTIIGGSGKECYQQHPSLDGSPQPTQCPYLVHGGALYKGRRGAGGRGYREKERERA
jgi:hypothetical protein